MEMPDTSPVTPQLVTTLFICALCEKPFTKEPQYKRHTAYCSKSHGRTRLRSCRACNQAKIKCNSCAPCQQCVRKGVRCLYDVKQPRRGRTAPVSKGLGEDVATAVANTVPITATTTPLDSELTLPDLGTEGLRLGGESDYLLRRFDQVHGFGASADLSLLQYSLSNDGAQNVDFNGMYNESSLSTATTTAMTITADVEGLVSLLQNASNDSITNDVDFQLENYSYDGGRELQISTFSPAPPTSNMINPSSSFSVPSSSITALTNVPSPSSDTVLTGHFAKNKVQTSTRQIFSTMIVDLIHAYPRMMMRRETFPPFIHAYFPAGENQDNRNRLPEHLTHCMGIAQLFTVCNDDTRLFVWVTILAEMRGFRKRTSTFNKYDAVSALQASLLYLIMRAVDDPPQQARHDYDMLLIYEVVLNRAMELSNHNRREVERNTDTQWTDWIFAESGRRIACVWFILGLVFHVRTGAPCFISDHFREIPLPCTKTEWEAKTESQWRIEHEDSAAKSRSTSRRTALHTFGDLIDAHQRSLGGRESEILDVWNAGIDHLGVLLNLAVHLV